jgi:transcription antitermination factor NusG
MNHTAALARDDAPLRWFWLRYLPHKETVAEYRLQDQGYQTYLPRCLLPTGRVEPLFPHYMAIGHQAPVWRSVRATRGVCDVLTGASEDPAPFPQECLDAIRAREEGGYIRIKGPKCKGFEHGDRVKILGDKFAGHSAVFDEPDGKERSRLLVYLFGAERPVVVPNQFVGLA